MMAVLRAVPKIVVALVIAGLLASTVFYRWQSEKKDASLIANQATIATQSVANKSLQNTIRQMIDFRRADQEAFAKLLENQAGIIREAAATSSAIAKLRKDDAQVDKYLREPVPVALRKLINGLRDEADNADSRNKDNRDHAAQAAR